MRGLTRRNLLQSGAAAGVGVAAGAGIASLAGGEASSGAGATAVTVDPYGPHQAGIVTPAQDRLVFASLDLVDEDRSSLQHLLQAWTTAIERMAAGKPVGTVGGAALAPPADTGEAQGLTAAHLTVTVGLGPELFTKGGKDRLGLAAKQPEALRPLPALPGDELEAERSGGDLCIQACADDPQVAFHAMRNLVRIARPWAQLRWTQLGFGRTASTSRSQQTPRNLMGFKDGTRNIVAEDTAGLDEFVWVGREGGWLAGGSYLVARRINMLIESWDRASLSDQEATFGRTKVTGAPLTGAGEFDTPDLDAEAKGAPVIPAGAHIRVAAPEANDGVRLLRRGYSFTDGITGDLGQLDAGLFFISFQRDPQQFVKVQTQAGKLDMLNEYIRHTGSAVFAVPPGFRSGGYLGEGLFTS